MLKIGIIGSGFGAIGLKPAFGATPGCRVVGICTDRALWRTFLQRNDLDAVAIAIPPNEQYKVATAAITKGIHVFAEKPLAANAGQAKELFALAKKKKVVHGIDFLFPEIAAWQTVKTFIEKKKFGRLLHVSVDWVWLSGDIQYGRSTWKTNVKEGGGALSFYFSHGLHYLEHFAGRIQKTQTTFAYSRKSKNGGEVGFDMLLAFKGGASGNVHLSSNTHGRIRHRLMFQCERGTILLENKNAVVDNFIITVSSGAGKRRVPIKKDIGRRGEDERVKIVRKLAKRFVYACTHGTRMAPSFADGVRVQELIERIRARTHKSDL